MRYMRDEDCTDLIVEMPATDKKGASSVTIEKTQDTVYLKEISAPQGYVLDTNPMRREISGSQKDGTDRSYGSGSGLLL